MKFTGMDISNFRSIGEAPVHLTPLRKCNVLVGANNAGKSNVMRAVFKICSRYQTQTDQNDFQLRDLDNFRRDKGRRLGARLFFEAEDDGGPQARIKKLMEADRVWFDISAAPSRGSGIVDSVFAHIEDPERASQLLDVLVNEHFNRGVSMQAIQEHFRKRGELIFNNHFRTTMPHPYIIPEFRQVRAGSGSAFDGMGLVEALGNFQNPAIGNDADKAKFQLVENITRSLLQLPTATLGVTRNEPLELIIENEGLRLPLANYGTGVHELLILISAVLSVEGALVCIEEPEIHLHPRLQRALVEFLVRHTNNVYLLSTHSAALINDANEEFQVFHIVSKGGTSVGGPVLDTLGGFAMIQDLGFRPSDLLQANAVIWVEGPTDRVYIRRWIELLAPDLAEGNDYVFLYYRALFGLSVDPTSVARDAMVDVLQLNRNAIVVIDSDRKQPDDKLSDAKRDLADKVESSGGMAWITDGREIENYLSPAVVARACMDARTQAVEINLSPVDDFGEVLDSSLVYSSLEPLRYSVNKRAFSWKLAEHYTEADIEGVLRQRMMALIGKLRGWRLQ